MEARSQLEAIIIVEMVYCTILVFHPSVITGSSTVGDQTIQPYNPQVRVSIPGKPHHRVCRFGKFMHIVLQKLASKLIFCFDELVRAGTERTWGCGMACF